MWKRITVPAVVFLAVFVQCAKKEEAAVDAPFYADLQEAMREASAGQYIVVDFYTDW